MQGHQPRERTSAPSPSAFCFELADTEAIGGQKFCAVTLAHCQEQRMLRSQLKLPKNTSFSSCEPTPNTNSFAYDKDGKYQPYDP